MGDRVIKTLQSSNCKLCLTGLVETKKLWNANRCREIKSSENMKKRKSVIVNYEKQKTREC